MDAIIKLDELRDDELRDDETDGILLLLRPLQIPVRESEGCATK